MQLRCDFLFKCLLILYNPKGENIAAPETGWKTSFFRHNKRELLWVYQENIRMPNLCILCIPRISKVMVYVTSKFIVHLMDKGVEVQPEQCPHVRSISCFTDLEDPVFGGSFIKILWEVRV